MVHNATKYYLAFKRKEILTNFKVQINFEDIILSEVHHDKGQMPMIPHM